MLMIDGADGRDGAQLPRRNLGPVVQGDGGRYSWVVAELGLEGQSPTHGAGSHLEVLHVARFEGRIGDLFDQGDRVRVVWKPTGHPDHPGAGRQQDPASVGELGRLGDEGHRADREAGVAAAHLRAALNEDDAKLPVAGEAVASQGPVARLEDVQRQAHVGKEHRAEREHGKRERPAARRHDLGLRR